MTTKASREFKKLRSVDLAKWGVVFWIVKRKALHREASYTVFRVDIDQKLEKRLKQYVRTQVQSKEFHLAEYDFTNADTDDVFLTLESDATDFLKVENAIAKVQSAISDGFENGRVTEYDQLLNSWAYVLAFEHGKERLYAWRKINSMSQPKAVHSRKALLFRNQRLTDLDEKEVFLIDPHFDFFVFGGVTFIASKRDFESAMNFREGMKAHGGEILGEFESLGILINVAAVRSVVGNNLHYLRKLASIRRAGYYREPDYLQRLIKVNASEGWGLRVENGQIVADVATVELLLKLLNNDRLRSPINDELFDSAAKTKVGAPQRS
ncbi:MAG: DUF4868 domain-containing protein [Acidobacteria bacterium]|nr:DUF4868 domain-containing protein [Acidobacteriota bacterium]